MVAHPRDRTPQYLLPYAMPRMKADGTRIDLIAERLGTEQEPAGLLDHSIAFGRGGLFRAPRIGREA